MQMAAGVLRREPTRFKEACPFLRELGRRAGIESCQVSIDHFRYQENSHRKLQNSDCRQYSRYREVDFRSWRCWLSEVGLGIGIMGLKAEDGLCCVGF
jgi:hypothetical protein